jgi:predicted Zn-dependent protease
MNFLLLLKMFKQLSRFFRRCRRRWSYGLLSAIVAISLILSTPSPSYGASWWELLLRGVQILQLANLSDNQEVRLGQQINQQLIQQGKIRLSNKADLHRYLNQIGQRLVRRSQRPNIPYTFQVVNDRNINAFATMGGFIYINTGLIAKADNEAELASVVAHEIGHVVARHAVKQMQNAAISQGLLSATGLEESTAVQLGVQLAFLLPNSREDELEADRLGLLNLQRAGYAPLGMVTFLKKLLKHSNGVPSFLSTHPATSERLAILEETINPETAQRGDGLDSRAYQQRRGF